MFIVHRFSFNRMARYAEVMNFSDVDYCAKINKSLSDVPSDKQTYVQKWRLGGYVLLKFKFYFQISLITLSTSISSEQRQMVIEKYSFLYNKTLFAKLKKDRTSNCIKFKIIKMIYLA